MTGNESQARLSLNLALEFLADSCNHHGCLGVHVKPLDMQPGPCLIGYGYGELAVRAWLDNPQNNAAVVTCVCFTVLVGLN